MTFGVGHWFEMEGDRALFCEIISKNIDERVSFNEKITLTVDKEDLINRSS